MGKFSLGVCTVIQDPVRRQSLHPYFRDHPAASGYIDPTCKMEQKAMLTVLTCISKSLMEPIIFSRPEMLSKTFPYTSPGKNGQRWETGRKSDTGM